MNLKQRLQDDMKTAMRAKDSDTLSTVRMALAAVKQVEVDERIEVDDARVIAIITKMVKQRKESARMYEEAQRADLAAKEQAEIVLLQNYLPQMMNDEAIENAVRAAVAEVGAAGVGDMGKVMAVLKTRLAGQADMGEVSKKIKQVLAA
ncbi:GatB/YqeY domain-containing protein [Stenoxybacter acetivorans]|uniref:GatB/YqeY domain-containing protein n=1 Tax=Stenoxybacter acetivorans TaxID=422441 RepID=UPI00055F9CAD|nr:GatB/YqeY domain-containing protein [Stenoxybacter acetivorans]